MTNNWQEGNRKEILDASYLELKKFIENIYFRRVKSLDKINEIISSYNLTNYLRFCESIRSVEEFINFTSDPKQRENEIVGYLFAVNTRQNYNAIIIYFDETRGFETSVERTDYNGREYKSLTEWNNMGSLVKDIRYEFKRRLEYEKAQSERILQIKSTITRILEKQGSSN